MSTHDALEDYMLYCHVRGIANLIFDETIAAGIQFEDRRGTTVSPDRHRTQSGIFLGFKYGIVPTSLWTPWGEYRFLDCIASFVNQGAWTIAWANICNMIAPEYRVGSGLLEPNFGIQRLGPSVALPDPIVEDVDTYIRREYIIDCWTTHTQRFIRSNDH